MCSVTPKNFEAVFPEIKTLLPTAKFVAIDCEFSGLTIKNSMETSLFDTNDERYQKLRTNVTSFVPVQIGLSLFHYDRDKNKYTATTFSFYTKPKSLGPIDPRFSFQASSLQFLIKYNFDFNQLFYDGIPYLNKQQEAELRKLHEENIIQSSIIDKLRMEDSHFIDRETLAISLWFRTAKIDQIYTVPGSNSNEINYCLRLALYLKFSNQIVSFFDSNILKVKKVDPSVEIKQHFEEELIESTLGFTRIFRLLCQYKKPIVGHNLFLDLLFMYNHFEDSLPSSYETFKKNINALIPTIYDTKFISYRLVNDLPKGTKMQSNGLEDLYDFFKNGKGRHIVLNSPLIEQSVVNSSNGKFHDAGFDSFCSGYCFVRMIHFFATKRYVGSFERLVTSLEHMKAAEEYRNCVNVIRGNMNHLKMDGPDPVSQRPPWLHVVSTEERLDKFELTKELGKFGSIDVQMLKKNTAIVAVTSKHSANKILDAFKTHETIKVTTYNTLKHSSHIKTWLLMGTLFSTGLLFAFKTIVNPKK